MYFGKLHLLAAATVAALLVSEGAALPYNYGIGSLGRMAGDRRAPIGRLVVARTDSNSTSTETITSTSTDSASTSTEIANATSTDTSATTTTDASVASATIYQGSNPVDISSFPSIRDWNSCQSFLSSQGINLFINQINEIQVTIAEVTVIQIIIDDRGRELRRERSHAFPPPIHYWPEFDSSLGFSASSIVSASSESVVQISS